MTCQFILRALNFLTTVDFLLVIGYNTIAYDISRRAFL